MRIARLDVAAVGDTSLDEWPLLADAEVLPRSGVHSWPTVPDGDVHWHGYRDDATGEVQVSVPGLSAGGPGEFQYTVMLRGSEFGTLLGCMPREAVPEVLGAFLHAVDPELLGAVVGRLIAHVAAASGRRGEPGA
jgi:hypothetical protein